MNKEITWDAFRKTGALWWLNSQLHLFGLAIVVETDEKSDQITRVYPVETSFRGFNTETNGSGYGKLTKHLEHNMPRLIRDTN